MNIDYNNLLPCGSKYTDRRGRPCTHLSVSYVIDEPHDADHVFVSVTCNDCTASVHEKRFDKPAS
ncbi:hypothetical protein [Thermomonospora umbrina]|uniref:Uncharacterized protein n=1 Tax=Thermomonospora umbrina TaxID=111806 RepID=A0A3D9T6N7_9ACTN|nr:hypothetical protein [Thermomonospora umbrina]REF00335.1 hypothetical protein DFJ69_5867 [Thermomonospora umbrina]